MDSRRTGVAEVIAASAGYRAVTKSGATDWSQPVSLTIQ
jgi:hypothetical protein